MDSVSFECGSQMMSVDQNDSDYVQENTDDSENEDIDSEVVGDGIENIITLNPLDPFIPTIDGHQWIISERSRNGKKASLPSKFVKKYV